MAFAQEPTKTPESIGRIRILLTTVPPDTQEASFELIVMFDDGSETRRRVT